MLTEDQVKKIISLNESLQVQLADANTMLANREAEIDLLNNELAATTELRSRLDGQLVEIESMNNKITKGHQQAIGAEGRELELHQELTEMARLNKKNGELVKEHAYIQSQFADLAEQVTLLHQRNVKLQKLAAGIGELESMLESTKLERDGLKTRLATMESEKKMRNI